MAGPPVVVVGGSDHDRCPAGPPSPPVPLPPRRHGIHVGLRMAVVNPARPDGITGPVGDGPLINRPREARARPIARRRLRDQHRGRTRPPTALRRMRPAHLDHGSRDARAILRWPVPRVSCPVFHRVVHPDATSDAGARLTTSLDARGEHPGLDRLDEQSGAVVARISPAVARSPILEGDGLPLGAAGVIVVQRAIGRDGGMPRLSTRHGGEPLVGLSRVQQFTTACADRGAPGAGQGKARMCSRTAGSDAPPGSVPWSSRRPARGRGSQGSRTAGRGAPGARMELRWEKGRRLAWWRPPQTTGRTRPDAKGVRRPSRHPGPRW